MRPMLLKAGYNSSFTLGLIINSSDIAFLIPPSIGFIVFGVVTSTSVGKLFLSGIVPGILIFVMFSIYSYVYSRVKKVGVLPKATWAERLAGFEKTGSWCSVFRLLLSAVSMPVFSAPRKPRLLRWLCHVFGREWSTGHLPGKSWLMPFLDTGIITGVVFILVGAGQALSWFSVFCACPRSLCRQIIGADPTQLKLIIIVVIAYFVACMFVDPIVAIYVLHRFLQPYVLKTRYRSDLSWGLW